MRPEEEEKIIAAWSDTAAQLMKTHHIPMMPENYAVYFEYARGSNKKLKEAFDKLAATNTQITRDTVRQFYHNFIVRDVDSRFIVEASARVQNIMKTVLKTVESSTADTAIYNTELSNFSDELESNEGEDIKDFIVKMAERTKELREKGENLTEKLNASRHEVELLKHNLEEVSLQVSLDGLTGIANRKAFDDNLINHIRDSKENGKALCLLMIDVDNFKKFNDTYGHLLGDQVLRIVAQSLKDVVKGRDFVARFGGEEFAIILPDTPLRGGEIVGETIRAAIASRELKRKDTGESYGSVTVSIGVALFKPRYDDAETFIGRADKALYLSKKNGRNRVTADAA